MLGISVVTHDPVELGRAAGRLALERIENPTGPTRTIEIATRIVARGSAEIPPSR